MPSHLSYAVALRADAFRAVRAPTGQPLTIGQLVALPSWDFFDLLHLHTVELATAGELDRLYSRAAARGVRVVLTVHDLLPNIEADSSTYRAKLRLAAHRSDVVLTLTRAAQEQLREDLRLDAAAAGVIVAPHGAALSLDVAAKPRWASPEAPAYAVYGALRPNRDVLAVVRAWQLLTTEPRIRLRVLLRSVRPGDEVRDAPTLDSLRRLSSAEADLDLRVTSGFVSEEELVEWLAPASVLVLPYRSVTHSGQLELGRDLGLAVLAPDVPTLRAQLGRDSASMQRVRWYPRADLEVAELLAGHLTNVAELPLADEAQRQSFLQWRRDERVRLLDLHRQIYAGERGGSRR